MRSNPCRSLSRFRLPPLPLCSLPPTASGLQTDVYPSIGEPAPRDGQCVLFRNRPIWVHYPIVNGKPTNSRLVLAILTACAAVLMIIVYKVVGYMEASERAHHGVVLSLPLLCLTCGLLSSAAWMESNGRAAGPWRILIAL